LRGTAGGKGGAWPDLSTAGWPYSARGSSPARTSRRRRTTARGSHHARAVYYLDLNQLIKINLESIKSDFMILKIIIIDLFSPCIAT
jgi:hypothetical protein